MKVVQRVIRWFRVVSPPAWTVAITMSFYLAFAGLHQFTLALGDEEAIKSLGLAKDYAVALLTTAYAIFRGIAFHPVFRREYLAWLALTPWRYPKPLPLGPIQIVAQDLAVLVLLEILLLDAPFNTRLALPAIFLFVLISCWACSIWTSGSRIAAYELGYALGATLWVASWSSLASGVCLIGTYFFARIRLRQSFLSFPWGSMTQAQPHPPRLSSQRTQGTFTGLICGWSFDVLGPQRPTKLPTVERVMSSGLAGLWTFAILSHPQFELLLPVVVPILIFFGGINCATLVLSYVWSHAPPISFLGRLFTGRWVIPSYDVALIPIVYYLGIALLTVYCVMPSVGWPVRYVMPTAVTSYLLLINLASPDLEKWRLTSKARLCSWAYSTAKNDYEQL